MARSNASRTAPDPKSPRLKVTKITTGRSLWRRLVRFFQRPNPHPRLFEFDEELVAALADLAEREQRSEQDMAEELLSQALAQRDAADEQLERWRSLTPREQQVVALVCLNYTNEQIAARLVISPETVKTHIRNVLWKLNLSKKVELREALSHWDFSAYEDARL